MTSKDRSLERLVEEVAAEFLTKDAPATRSTAHRRAVAIGADHTGVAYKRQLAAYLREECGVDVVDCGTDSTESVDYPDIAATVAKEVMTGRCERGVVIDGAGIGSAIAANKLPGIRCALCHDLFTVDNARRHNDANILALGINVVNVGFAKTLLRRFLSTDFEGGRHARRVNKIRELERDR